MAITAYARGTDLATFGFYLEDPERWRESVRKTLASATLYQRSGVRFTGPPRREARETTIRGSVLAVSVAELQGYLDAIKALVDGAEVVVAVDDAVNVPRFTSGVCTSFTVDYGQAHPTAALQARVALTFLSENSHFRLPDPQIIALAAGVARACPLGTAPSDPDVWIYGGSGVVGPVLSLLHANGDTLASVGFSGLALPVNNALRISMGDGTITLVTAGVESDGLSLRTSGGFFGLDPQDGDFSWGSWPSLKLTASSGSPSGEALYFQNML